MTWEENGLEIPSDRMPSFECDGLRLAYREIGAAHAAHLERPAEVARVVSDFLARVDDGVGLAPTATPKDQES